MFADVLFSDAGVGVISVMVSALWASLVLMWKAQKAQTDDVIGTLRRQNDRLLKVILDHGLRSCIDDDQGDGQGGDLEESGGGG